MIYYLETNLIAIIIGAVLLIQIKKMSSVEETTQLIMGGMIRLLIVLCVCDVAAYASRGRSYVGVEVANIGYFITMAIGAYLWFLYIYVKMNYIESLNRIVKKSGVPVFLLCIAILSNPLTGLFFTVDENILYHRGPGVFLTWIVEWVYILAALIVNIRALRRERRNYLKSTLRGYMVFVIPIAAAAVVQMLVYGTTTTQIGFAIAIFMAYNNNQKHQVQSDALTGLNNKNAFLRYRDSMVNRRDPAEVTMMMIDADNFKRINDTYGHLKGDQALRDIANILKKSTTRFVSESIILYRYAGDEFVITSENLSRVKCDKMIEVINKGIEETNAHNSAKGERYTIGLSIGVARKMCANELDFDELLKDADQAMYEVKKNRNIGR